MTTPTGGVGRPVDELRAARIREWIANHQWATCQNGDHEDIRFLAALAATPPPAGDGPLDVTAGELSEWLDSFDGRVEDIMALWTQGKRTSRWAAEQLIDEGHLARLPAHPPADAGYEVNGEYGPASGRRFGPSAETTP